MIRIANASNGLMFPPYTDVSNFMSTHAHHKTDGYFRMDAMPYSAIISLLRGQHITLIDATTKTHGYPDAFKYGVPTFCLVFNRAIGFKRESVCAWQTKDMIEVAHSNFHNKLKERIRHLNNIFGNNGAIKIGEAIFFEVHYRYVYDDKPMQMIKHLHTTNLLPCWSLP
jgi:hypothetical protein